MEKENVIELLNSLKNAIESENVPTIINLMGKLRIDTSFYSPITDVCRELITATIKDAVSKTPKKCRRIQRKGEYGTTTYDYYKIENNVLKRNGYDTKFTSVGKLYTAYKIIMKIQS